MQTILALAWKDWLRYSRQPFLIVVSVVMPLVFIFFYAIIVPSSSTNPVAVALEADNAAARQFVDVLDGIASAEADYYDILTTDPQEARALFAEGDTMGLIVIPTDFDAENARVELYLRNINSDYTKNLRLRLDYAVRTFNAEVSGREIRVAETRWLPEDPTMQNYISTSLLLFACLYSAMINTGLQVASEWNDRTVKTLLLAPVNRGVIIAGKMLAGLGQSVIAVGIVLLVLVTVFNFQIVGSVWALAGIVTVVLLLGAGIGAVVGVASKQTLAVTSLLITLSIGLFLISGNEDSLRGLAWEGPIVGLWQFSRILPTTYAFLAARSLLLTGDTSTLAVDLLVVILTTVIVIAFARALLYRAYSQLPGGQ